MANIFKNDLKTEPWIKKIPLPRGALTFTLRDNYSKLGLFAFQLLEYRPRLYW